MNVPSLSSTANVSFLPSTAEQLQQPYLGNGWFLWNVCHAIVWMKVVHLTFRFFVLPCAGVSCGLVVLNFDSGTVSRQAVNNSHGQHSAEENTNECLQLAGSSGRSTYTTTNKGKRRMEDQVSHTHCQNSRLKRQRQELCLGILFSFFLCIEFWTDIWKFVWLFNYLILDGDPGFASIHEGSVVTQGDADRDVDTLAGITYLFLYFKPVNYQDLTCQVCLIFRNPTPVHANMCSCVVPAGKVPESTWCGGIVPSCWGSRWGCIPTANSWQYSTRWRQQASSFVTATVSKRLWLMWWAAYWSPVLADTQIHCFLWR